MTGKIRSPWLDSGIHLMTPVLLHDNLLWGGQIPYGNMWNGYDYTYMGYDPLPYLLSRTIWDHGFRDSYFALGFSGIDQTSSLDIDVPGHKPVNHKYHWPLDHQRYGSLLGNLAILGASPEKAQIRFKRDHEVKHYNVNGSVVAHFQSDDPQWFEFPYVKLGWILPGVSYLPTGPAGYQLALYSTAKVLNPILGPTTAKSQNLQSIFLANSFTHRVLETIGDTLEVAGDNSLVSRLSMWRKCSDILVSEDPDNLKITYVYEIHEDDGYRYGEAKYLITMKFELLGGDPPHVNPYVGPTYREVAYSTGGNYYTRVSYKSTRLYHSFSNELGTGTYEGGVFYNEIILNPMIRGRGASGATSVDVAAVSTAIVSAEERFGKYIEREFNDIRPSAFYSTADALESHLLTLKNNYVESFTEIGELVRLAPDIPLLIRALVLWRKNPVSSARAFGDFLSDFLLKHGFAWRPNAEAVAELSKMGPKLASSMERFGKSRTITVAGKYNYQFPWHPYWGSDIRLEVRSTAQIEYADSDFAQLILKLDSMGVLPDLHRVWETLPYSFAVDWVTSVGRRLHDVDTQAKLFSLMQLHWAEHTFRVTVPVPPHISLEGVDALEGDMELLYFRRELSRRLPPLRESKYDFREPAGLPSFGILASLLWQRS